MAIVKRLDEEELALLEVIRHPLWFGEFIRALDNDDLPKEEQWEYTSYQKEFLCDFNPYVSICCGRSIGKTVSIIDKLVWYSINKFWNDPLVYTVPNKVHLEPVFLRMSRWFRTNPFLSSFIGRTGINSQSYRIILYNSAVIDCRIAGQSGTGANVVGLHSPIIIVDEAALYPWGTWLELQPCLNTWEEGFQLIVSGVPTGMREKNVLYQVDQRETGYTKHRVSQHMNPRYTDADEKRNRRQYGGVEGEDYVHLVLGEHGAPSYALFDRARMLIGKYSVFRATLSGTKIKEDKTYLTRFYNALPQMEKDVNMVEFGIDLGYTDPTVIFVLYRVARLWRYLARITLRHVEYPLQEVIIDRLDSFYNPQVLGIDEGSSGKAVVQHLLGDQKFKYKNYKDRIVPVQFRSMLPVGMDEAGDRVEVRAKEFAMQLLQTKVNNHEIQFTSLDEAVIGELERTTYSKTPSGELVFKTLTLRGGTRHGEDHNLAALLCFIVGHYMTEEFEDYSWRKHKGLYRPRWG